VKEETKKNYTLRWIFGIIAFISIWAFGGAYMTVMLAGAALEEVSGLIGFIIGIFALVCIIRS
jgi:hypothetical protein